jgi:hypothetical protein
VGVAATIAALAIGGGATIGAAPAYATDGQTVNFTGGSVLSVLVCKSEPSPAQVTVRAESRVMFVNRLGQTATLRVDGQAVSTVGANQAVPVVFHHGPVSVSMTFSCGAGVVEKFSSASVSVTAAPRAATPNVAGAPPTIGAPSGAGAPVHSAPGASHAGAVGGRAVESPPQGPEGTATGAPTVDAAAPSAPAVTDGPSADPSALAVDPTTDGTFGGPATGSTAVAVEPLVPASGTPRESASGLLALIAAVCAVGVTIATTRAIISKRTIQAYLA